MPRKSKIDFIFERGINSRYLLDTAFVVTANKKKNAAGIQDVHPLAGLGWI